MSYIDKVNLTGLGGHLKNLPDDFVILIVSPPGKYENTNIEISKLLCNEEKLSGLYVTFAHPYNSIFRVPLQRDERDVACPAIALATAEDWPKRPFIYGH